MNTRERPKRRSWRQFSLRAVLILMTILAIWLGIVSHRARNLRRAVDAIAAVGGSIHYHYELNAGQGPPGPAWLRKLLGDEYFVSPFHVELTGDGITDGFLEEHLAALRTVEYLVIESLNVTDTGIEHVASLRNVSTLHLTCPKMTDAALSHIATLRKIDALGVNSPCLTASGVRRLRSLNLVNRVGSYHDLGNRDAVRSLGDTTIIEVNHQPLSDVLAYLVDYHEVSFISDDLPEAALEIPVTVKIDQQPLGEALDAILTPHDVGYYVDAARIRITSRVIAERHRQGETAFR